MPKQQVKTKKTNIILPGRIGNILEWYDFSLYGYFASIISELYFPADNQTSALIKTFGIFAVGFLMRPIGAIVLPDFCWFNYAGRRFLFIGSISSELDIRWIDLSYRRSGLSRSIQSVKWH